MTRPGPRDDKWTSAAIDRVTSTSLRGSTLHTTEGAVSLAVGEPSFDTPAVIKDAFERALRQGATHYAPQGGLPELREAIAEKELRHRDLALDDSHVLITHGGTAGLASAILGCVSTGDIVAIEDPTYSLYADLVALAGGQIRTYMRGADGRLDEGSLATACDGARMLILCQPSNPTGAVLSARDWDLVAGIADKHDLIVLSDEAYEGLVYDDVEYVSVLDRPDLRDRLIASRTFSKKFAMTGWRVGYLAASDLALRPAAVAHRTFNGAVNTAVQWAALTALMKAEDAATAMRREFERRRATMDAEIAKTETLHATPPDGAFYYWCHYEGDDRSSVEVAAAARKAGVTVRPGQEFGSSGKHALRLSFAPSPEDILLGMARLREVIHHQ